MSSPTSETPAVMPRQTMWGHTSRVRGVVHLPGGRRIITGSWDGSLRLWDMESSAQIGEDWRDDGDEAVRTKASSPNGKIVASGSAQINENWRDDDGEEEEIGVNTMALSPIGKTVASGSYDGTVRLWDVETGKVIAKWRGCTEKVWSVCWSADGERVLSGSGDGTARVWVVKC